MLGSSILDVAIGMAFIYLLLSLIASSIQEALAAIVQARAANLEHGIRSLFSGGKLDGQYFVDLIYNHGLIRGLYQDPKMDKPDPTNTDGVAGAPRRKSRPRLEKMRDWLGIEPSAITHEISDPFLLPSYIPARTFAIALIDILNPDKLNGNPPLDNIEQRLAALAAPTANGAANPSKAAAEAMLSLLADANTAKDAAARFQLNIENWYNDAMDRVSGWYKKHTQRVLMVIGLALAVGFNVDSIHVGKTLWFDHDARQGLVSAAASFVDKNPQATAAVSKPAGTDAKANLNADAGASIPTGPTEQELADKMKTTVRAFNEVSEQYLLPVGWRYSLADYVAIVKDTGRWNAIHIVEMIAGWLTTAFALSFGAPFWFDTLNKFMVVRSTVKPQEKSQNETSKS